MFYCSLCVLLQFNLPVPFVVGVEVFCASIGGAALAAYRGSFHGPCSTLGVAGDKIIAFLGPAGFLLFAPHLHLNTLLLLL